MAKKRSEIIAENIASMRAQGSSEEEIASYVESVKAQFANRSQEKAQEGGTFLDPLAKGVTFGLSDELQGIGGMFAKFMNQLSSQPLGKSEITGEDFTYKDAYKGVRDEVRSDQKAFEERNPNAALALEIGGGVLTGGIGGAKALGSQAIKNAPRITKAAAVPAIYGAEGAAYGFGTGEGMEDSIRKGLEEGAVSAVAGPILNKGIGALGNRLFKGKAKALSEASQPTTDLSQLRSDAKDLYKIVDNSKVQVHSRAFKPFKNWLLKDLSRQGVDVTDNIFKNDYPKLNKALKKLNALEEPTLKQLGSIKRNLESPIKSGGADAYFAHQIDSEISKFIKNMTPAAASKGKELVTNVGQTLEKADDLWSRMVQGKSLEKMWNKAQRSESVARHGDWDSALSAESRSLLNSDKRMLGIDDSVATSLDDLITGDMAKRLTRSGASMSPAASSARGAAPTVATVLAATAGYAGGGPAGALLTAGAPITMGFGFQKLLNKMTKSEFKRIQHAIVNKGQKEVEELLFELTNKYNIAAKSLALPATAIGSSRLSESTE